MFPSCLGLSVFANPKCVGKLLLTGLCPWFCSTGERTQRVRDIPKAVLESGLVTDNLSRTISHGRAEMLAADVLMARLWSLLLSWKELSTERWMVPLDDFTERTQILPSPSCFAMPCEAVTEHCAGPAQREGRFCVEAAWGVACLQEEAHKLHIITWAESKPAKENRTSYMPLSPQ